MKVMDRNVVRYSMRIEWSPLDDAFVVTVPELPGCRTHGATYAEAAQHGVEAIQSWLDAALADGETPPPPRTLEDRAA